MTTQAKVSAPTQATSAVPAVFGDEGWLRNRFHTRRGAALINLVTRPLWTRFPPHGFGVLTTVGRRTGLERRPCIRVVVRGERAFLVSIVGARADWLRNVRHDDRVHLRARGTTTAARVRDPDGADELREARRAFCEARHPSDYIECFLHRKGAPSKRRIRELHEHWFDQGTPLVLDLEP